MDQLVAACWPYTRLLLLGRMRCCIRAFARAQRHRCSLLCMGIVQGAPELHVVPRMVTLGTCLSLLVFTLLDESREHWA